jgi:hypothetical protein
MKLPNFLIHTFAAVGVISLIFWGCAAADSDSIDNPPQLTGGTYQVETLTEDRILVLNTETGVMKTYYKNGATNGIWTDLSDFEITFTH